MCPAVVVTTSLGSNCVVTFIFVTSDNNIIVGVKEPGGTYTPTDKSTRALLIFGMDGKQQHTYQYDSNTHRRVLYLNF
jgi:hypothetical protein